MLVDTHCHLDLFPDPTSVAREAEDRSISTIAVTNAPSLFFFTSNLAQSSRHIRAALGLHPELVATHGHEIDAFLATLYQTRYVGEIGLDYSSGDQDLRQKQRTILGRILTACAQAKNKVLTLHSRRAAGDVIDHIGKDFPGTVILHWFSGSQKELRRGLEFGFYFSVNPAMTQSESGRKLISLMPFDRILTETDGPFVRVGDSPAQPYDVRSVIGYLAKAWQKPGDAVEQQVVTNLRTAVGSF
jgi:TatD DNase family protein